MKVETAFELSIKRGELNPRCEKCGFIIVHDPDCIVMKESSLSYKISLKEHKLFGMQWKILNDKLCKLSTEIHNSQRTKAMGRLEAKHWEKALIGLNELRNHMEEIMFKDYPKQSITETYYGARPEINKSNDENE